MNKNRIIAGIELGSSKIATVISQVNYDPVTFERNINIVGVASSESKGIKKGIVDNIEQAIESTITSVEAAERMAGYHLDSAIISISDAYIHSQNSHGVVAVSDPDGEISQSDVDRVIEAAAAINVPQSREVIHVIPREFVVDGEVGVEKAIGMSGVRLEADTHIITAAVPVLKSIKKVINDVGIDIESMIFGGIAAAASSVSKTEKDIGCVLVDVGGGTTKFVVYMNGSPIYSGVIPIGGENITRDLVAGLRGSLEVAEKVKIALSEDAKKPEKDKDDNMDLTELGISEIRKVSKKTLIEGIIRPRLNEIFTIVKLELEKAELLNQLPSGVIITGGGAETAGIVDSARRMMMLPVRIGKPRDIKGLIDDIINPAFSVPVGLIIHGANEEPKENLNSLSRKFKLPSVGIAGKVIDVIKNLLP
ncbi:cell division protein FtsA [Patescibacteria group bacterium]